MIENGRVKGVRFVRARASGGPMTPRVLVLHDTAGQVKQFSSVDWFASRECTTSAHFVVERDGTVTQMVETNRKAYHAGVSTWKNQTGLNSNSIGIEIVNPGILVARGDLADLIYKDGSKKKIVASFPLADCVEKSTPDHGSGYWMPYTGAQIAAVKLLCTLLVEEYPDVNEIVGHWQISPGRKIDPNPLFPFREVRKAVLEPDHEEAEKIEAVVARPVAKPSMVPEIVKEASKSTSARLTLGGIMLAIEKYFGFVRDALPDAKTETDSVVDPLTSLGGLLKINMTGIVAVVSILILIIVIYRHSRDKTELKKLKGETA